MTSVRVMYPRDKPSDHVSVTRWIKVDAWLGTSLFEPAMCLCSISCVFFQGKTSMGVTYILMTNPVGMSRNKVDTHARNPSFVVRSVPVLFFITTIIDETYL